MAPIQSLFSPQLKAPRSKQKQLSNGVNKSANTHEREGHSVSIMASQQLAPIANVAERVGREVEAFAERLDAWRDIRESENSREATFSLLDDYKSIADSTVDTLGKKHGSKHHEHMQNLFADRVKKLQMTEGEDGERLFQSEADLSKPKDVEEFERWQQESETWDLLVTILQGEAFRLHMDGQVKNAIQELSRQRLDQVKVTDVWNEFLLKNPLASERYFVIKWLETTAEHTGDDLGIIAEQLEAKAGRDSGIWSHGWLDTREQIKGTKRLRRWDWSKPGSSAPRVPDSTKTRNVISTLDPDAPFREDGGLEANDQFFERSVWLTCYELLRRGKNPAEVRQWFQDRHENWRTVSLGAAVGSGHMVKSPQEIYNHSLWRQTCLMAAQNPKASEYERAVYGLLGGDFMPVELVCRSWDDLLYANYKAILADEFAEFCRSRFPKYMPEALSKLGGANAPKRVDPDQPELTAWGLIEDLRDGTLAGKEARTPLKIIQGSFIGHDPQMLIARFSASIADLQGRGGQVILAEQGSKYLRKQDPFLAMATDPNALRIMVHLVLVLQDLEHDSLFDTTERIQAGDNIIVGYIEFLKKARKFDLIPLYASFLQDTQPEQILGDVLEPIEDSRERRSFINMLKNYNLNTVEVLKSHYGWALSKTGLSNKHEKPFELEMLEETEVGLWPGHRIKAEFFEDDVTADEEMVIKSLEWFLLLEGNWVETFQVLTQAIRTFLVKGRIAAALAVSNRLSTKSISELKTVSIFGMPVDVSIEEDAEDILEMIGNRKAGKFGTRSIPPGGQRKLFTLLRAQCKTYKDLENLVQALRALRNWRTVEDNTGLAGDTSVYQRASKEETKHAYGDVVASTQPLLGKWLTTSTDTNEAKEHKLLRNIYVPQTILGYNSVLDIASKRVTKDAALYSMELPGSIASDAHDLAASNSGADLAGAFLETGMMEALVQSLTRTSTTMLKLNQQSTIRGKKPKKRGAHGETLEIWDPNAPTCPAEES
ncbi:MAG: Nucleoporin nup84 [Bogoriella megaspora]|nr:MAG: Nucleoporin nup84 [Bogoriella megaspora]